MSPGTVPNKGSLRHVMENGGEIIGSRPVLTSSADHPITIASNRGQSWRYRRRRYTPGAHATRGELSAVQYIPRKHVNMSLLARSDHASYCPFKGEASYFNLKPLGDDGASAVWIYEAPYPAVAAIAGHVAFYPDRVTITQR
jgi:hypothetical protein